MTGAAGKHGYIALAWRAVPWAAGMIGVHAARITHPHSKICRHLPACLEAVRGKRDGTAHFKALPGRPWVGMTVALTSGPGCPGWGLLAPVLTARWAGTGTKDCYPPWL